MKRILIYTGAGLLLLLLLLAGGLWIFRNRILNRMAERKITQVDVIKEIQQWRWRVDEKSGEYTDEPVNVFDDAMAALRYGVESWRKDKKAKIYSREEYGI